MKHSFRLKMKTFSRILYFLIMLPLTMVSCVDYLEKTPNADVTEADVFATFDKFQGYVETMYDDIVDPIHKQASFAEFNNGDDIIPTRSFGWIEGDYFRIIGNNNTQYYNSGATRVSSNVGAPIRDQAIWQNSWYGIRAANITLAHLQDLMEPSPGMDLEEQRKLLEGQAYFFRGYFHLELMKAWGNIPFIDTVYTVEDEMLVPQKGLYALSERIVADLQKAADLLPVDWDLTETGKLTIGSNSRRATKGLALANMAECLLYCSSPLFNGVEKGSYTYNTDYCKRAAAAAWKVIELGSYALEPWSTYRNNFYAKNRKFPWTKEMIFNGPNRGDCRYFTSSFTFGHIGTDAWYSAPTQNYVENFEMASGLPIDDPASGFNPMKPWDNRDPRFKYNILVDGDRQVTSIADARAFVELYIGGRERTAITSLTGYGWRKYWDETLNVFDNGWNNYTYSVPKIRLAEIYLIYAETANEAYGPNGKDPNASLTAVEAVNKVRERAGFGIPTLNNGKGMPGVNAKFLVSKEAFRERIWNERAVELAYENKRWYDLRRWHVHHLPKHRELYELQFDKNKTYFNKVLIKTIQFGEQHYWLPFPTNQVNLYSAWKQNPGW